ncbi:MAG: nitroreductase family deazaflavin-dependent oxidoreductase [Nocardioides sp.]
MSLVADLGYTHRRGNSFQRALQAFASTRPGAWFFSKTLARLDRATDRLTRGRVSLPEVLAGLPSLVLTTTGRKSGQARATHLVAVPLGDTLALLGTNFGQPHTPAWVLNLEADPRASVTYRGVSRVVVARPATGPERAEILANSSGVYGGYRKYQQRISGRRLRMFVLEPAG